MANTLTDLIPTLYASLDIVSREITGMIPSVALNAAPTGAAKDEAIAIPVTQAATAYDVTPAVTAPDNGDQTINNVEIKITKSRMNPERWNGKQQHNKSNYEQ